ncbi:hypothetical protein Gpo141_00010241, partial [Globisporangium polare]
AIVGLTRQTRALRAMYANEKRGESSRNSRTFSQSQHLKLNPQQHRSSIMFSRLMHISKRIDASAKLRSATSSLKAMPHAQEQLRRLQLAIAKSPGNNRKKHGLNRIAPSEQPKVELSGQANQLAVVKADVLSAEPSLEYNIFTESVRLLHESEAVAVIEYIETVVPVFYALYISILFHLPNAQYYQDMKLLTAQKLHTVVANILLYAFMELLSLIGMHKMLKRSFGVSMLHQLAFTMEREWRLFQCNFVSWILVVFQFLLIHNAALPSRFRVQLLYVSL